MTASPTPETQRFIRPPLVELRGGEALQAMNRYLPASAVLARVAFRLLLDQYARGAITDPTSVVNFAVMRVAPWATQWSETEDIGVVHVDFWDVTEDALRHGSTTESATRRYITGGSYVPVASLRDGQPDESAWTEITTLRRIALPHSELDRRVLALFGEAFLRGMADQAWGEFDGSD